MIAVPERVLSRPRASRVGIGPRSRAAASRAIRALLPGAGRMGSLGGQQPHHRGRYHPLEAAPDTKEAVPLIGVRREGGGVGGARAPMRGAAALLNEASVMSRVE